MTDDIKLPALPEGFTKHNLVGHDEAVFTDLQMIDYARAALAQQDSERDALRAENERLREALTHIAEYWNGDRNDDAVYDMCVHASDTARAALQESSNG